MDQHAPHTFLIWAISLALPLATATAEVVARVNDTEITSEQIDRHLERSLGSEWSKLPKNKLLEARKSVLEQQIRTELIEQEIRALGVKVSPREVNERLGEVRQQIKLRYGGKTSLEQELRKNYSYIAFLARMTRGGIGLYKYLEQKTTDAEIRKYFKEHPKKFRKLVKARHILVPTIDIQTRAALPQQEQDNARRKAQMVRSLLKADASNFAELAKTYSMCPSKKRGGDLGWFGDKRMDPNFTKALWDLEKGDITGVVQTRFGFHIIQLTDRKVPRWQDARKACIYTRQEQYMKKLLASSKVERLLTKTSSPNKK